MPFHKPKTINITKSYCIHLYPSFTLRKHTKYLNHDGPYLDVNHLKRLLAVCFVRQSSSPTPRREIQGADIHSVELQFSMTTDHITHVHQNMWIYSLKYCNMKPPTMKVVVFMIFHFLFGNIHLYVRNIPNIKLKNLKFTTWKVKKPCQNRWLQNSTCLAGLISAMVSSRCLRFLQNSKLLGLRCRVQLLESKKTPQRFTKAFKCRQFLADLVSCQVGFKFK